MKEGVKKKGLSPVIASVLLILLVLVLASIIFLWARGFIGEQLEKFGQPIEESCRNINFEVVRLGTDLKNSKLEVLNKGDIDIRHLEIRMTKGGDSAVRKFDFLVNAHEAVTETISFVMPNTIDVVPDEIVVYPVLVGRVVGEASSNNVFTCTNSGVTLN